MKKQLLNNPFLITGYISPAYFCDRIEETKKILEALANGRDITLISPRRYGKTGLIKHSFHTIQQSNPTIKCIYIDLFSTKNMDDLIGLFAGKVIEELNNPKEKTLRNIGNIFKNMRPVITYDAMTGQPSLSVTIDKNIGKEKNLDEIFEYLKNQSFTCYIAFDEFQQISNYPEKGVEALLRSYIQFLPNVQFIFSGSMMHTMQEMFLSPKRPFFQSTQIMTLEPIEKAVYYEFAKKHFKDNSLDIHQSCFNLIYDEFEGHTWYVQAILNRLYAFNLEITDEKFVFEAITQLMNENSYYYQELLKAYSTVQQNLIEAIASEKYVEQINAGDFITKYKLKSASSVNRALTKLLDNEVVYKNNQKYMIYDRLMGLWLAKLRNSSKNDD